MRKLPTRRWGPWRQEFYSFHSNPRMVEKDLDHKFGSWKNVWIAGCSRFIYKRWPDFWRKVRNFRGW